MKQDNILILRVGTVTDVQLCEIDVVVSILNKIFGVQILPICTKNYLVS